MALHKLRAKVAEYLEQHMYESAVFLADKLVTMSDGCEEVRAYLTFGLVYFLPGQIAGSQPCQ